MGKKYVVEIGENENLYKTMITNGGKSYIGVVHGEPYTEPDLEQVRKEAYEQGRKDVETQFCSYDACKNRQEEYQRGLADAWEAARKISTANIDGGFSWEVMNNIFGTEIPSKIFKTLTASEAIEKIRQYEQRQEEQIKVGDEVEMKCGVSPAIYMQGTNGSDKIYLLFNDGSCGIHCRDEIGCKTGRHFPEIASVLEKMRGEQDG